MQMHRYEKIERPALPGPSPPVSLRSTVYTQPTDPAHYRTRKYYGVDDISPTIKKKGYTRVVIPLDDGKGVGGFEAPRNTEG